MKESTIHEDDFKNLLKEVSNLTQWNDYCRNNYPSVQFNNMSTEEKKYDFEDYVDNESIQSLINENYWIGIFKEEPTIIYDNLKGFLDDI